MKNREFVDRLNIAFDHQRMSVVARRLGIPHATVRNYYQGRLPAPEVLMKIGLESGVSLNWLLTGQGDRYSGQVGPMDLGKFFEEKITDIINRKFAEKYEREEQGTEDEEQDTEHEEQETEDDGQEAEDDDSEASGTDPSDDGSDEPQ